MIQNLIRRIAGKLTAVERRYKEKQKETGKIKLDKTASRQLIDEGIKLMDEEAWDRAEKKFIEVIGADPKNVEAYEKLGRLYLFKKDYALAKQTFKFLSKLSKNDASVIASLGEVEEKLGSQASALNCFKESARLSPKNPKYLDFLITSAIVNKDVHEAMSALDQLKTVNPENKKIEVFEKKIEETRADMKQSGAEKIEKSSETK